MEVGTKMYYWCFLNIFYFASRGHSYFIPFNQTCQKISKIRGRNLQPALFYTISKFSIRHEIRDESYEYARLISQKVTLFKPASTTNFIYFHLRHLVSILINVINHHATIHEQNGLHNPYSAYSTLCLRRKNYAQ